MIPLSIGLLKRQILKDVSIEMMISMEREGKDIEIESSQASGNLGKNTILLHCIRDSDDNLSVLSLQI